MKDPFFKAANKFFKQVRYEHPIFNSDEPFKRLRERIHTVDHWRFIFTLNIKKENLQ